ncbi:MAG: Asp-tRNA(Asn)/Glu-tRNA(Gln) amidotransferase subunit GatC [Nitrospirae bacterium]|nr:Asp-tRNA(Asn)/Glu-tRNA(Gln) amidotransferase subunit GatC [Nitrospirota bacterium]
MKITVDMVEKVAALGRLEYSAEENETLTRQLDGILTYVEKLNELDTTGVEPTSHVLPISNVFRDDVPRPSLSQDDALGNAPDRAGEFYRVPKIIE